MVSRPAHTIPYSTGRFKYEEEEEKIIKIQEYVPLSPKIIEYIVGYNYFTEKQSKEEDAIDISDEAESDEEISDEVKSETLCERRPTGGRMERLTQLLETAANKEDMDEASEKCHVGLLHKFSEDKTEDETEKEIEEEKPFYDIEERGRQLREQEEENERDLQQLYNNAKFFERKYNELKIIMDKDVKNLLKDLRQFDDEDLEDLKEEIEAVLQEEGISSIDSLDEEEE